MSTRPSVLRGQSLKAVVPALDDLGSRDRLGSAARSAIAQALDEARRQGHAEGYETGMSAAAEHAAAVAARHEARILDVLQALQHAVEELTRREALALDNVEAAVIQGAILVAGQILARELESTNNGGAEAIARALALAPAGDVIVRLHPDDAATVEDAGLDGPPARHAAGRRLTIVPDPSIERGGCVADVGACHIDAQFKTALARVEEALR